MKNPKWITVTEAAELADRTPVTIRRWAREELIDATMSGGVWLISRDDLLRFLREGRPRRIIGISDDTAGALRQAWRRVGRDLQRDDLPDIIEHKDFEFNLDSEIELLAQEITGGYQPKAVRIVEMPKSDVLSRPLADLTVEDRVVYEACVQTIAPSIDSLLHDKVFSYRLASKPSGSRMLRHFSAAFRDFQDYISGDAWVATGATVCLSSDVASCYEYVDHRALLDALEVDEEHLGAVELLGEQLRSWRTQHQVIGLPQGPAGASGVLSNAYLLSVDSACLAASLAYARYGDDFRIFFADEADARRFAPRLIKSLRALGLNLSSAKTRIQPVEELAADDRARRRAAVSYGVEIADPHTLGELRAIFDAAVHDPADVDQTDLTFSLWRLGLLEDDYPLSWLLEHFADVPFGAGIIADYLARLGNRPEAAEALTGYLTSADNVHPWTEIRYLRLIGTFDLVEERLLARLRYLAFETQGILGDFAARVLGAVGTGPDRRDLRRFAARGDVAPHRRRAAIIGGADGPMPDLSWFEALAGEEHPAVVRRAALFARGAGAMPRTLVLRRTPEWAVRLRRRLEREGKLPPREPS